MKADTRTLQGIFHGDRRFVVPVYQRPYVWELERQWEPLWNDVEATATRLAEARIGAHARGSDAAAADQLAAPHFLGAIVIEDRAVITGEVDTRLVVDGQQRLTTLQLLLRGSLDALEEVGADSRLQARLRKAIKNDDEVVRAEELLKLSPRRVEAGAFAAAMDTGRPAPHDSKFAAARDYFYAAATAFLADESMPDDPYGGGTGPEKRAALLVATLLGLVKLVVIDLEDVDDAQVIFEALNARNTPLSATDLVKNLLFLQAEAQQGHDPQDLYDSLWKRFDDDSEWWLTAVGVGHAQRARQDWLLGDWLIAQRGRAINVGRLYGEFRQWLATSGTNPLDALSTLNSYADAYETLNGRRKGATERELTAFQRIERLNITAAMPVMLWLFVQPEHSLSAEERQRAILAIESFVVRRMAAKYQTRGYGHVFVDVLAAAQQTSIAPGPGVIKALRSAPRGYGWPTTAEVESAFDSSRYYGPGGINQERLRMILGAMDEVLQDDALKTETLTISYEELQVEHIIPRSWRTTWPTHADDEAARLVAEQRRDQHINRIGNLANGHLNPAMSNDPWQAKRAELQKHSKLQLNAQLVEHETWTEDSITQRGHALARLFDRAWPPPDSNIWEAT